MEMPKHTCSYKGGMNRDISPNEYPNTCYFDAKNLRVIVDNSDGLSSAALASPKGTSISFTLPDNTTLLGYTVLRDYLVILAHNTIAVVNPDKVYKIPLSQLTTANNLIINDNYYWINPNTNYLVYENSLGFNNSYPIKVVGNYENADIQKIYWADSLNTFKHLNIVYNATYNKLNTLDPQLLEILPNHSYGSYVLSEENGGHLKAGRIQYSYQLYSISGSETMFAPPSNLYNITAYNSTDGINFSGDDLETTVNKNIKITITLDADTVATFNRIRLVALQYEAFEDTPTVRVVSEKEFSSTTVIFHDYGDTIAELVLEEFQTLKNSFIPSTIETKNNYLFAGNIKEELFDVDEIVKDLTYPVGSEKTFFDSRAYRWRYIPTGELAYDTYSLDETTDPIGSAGYVPNYNVNSFHITTINQLDDNGWQIIFQIGVEAQCAAAGPPARNFVSVSSIDGEFGNEPKIDIALYDINGLDWDSTLRLTGITKYSYGVVGPNLLAVSGTSYEGMKPSQLDPIYLGYPDITEYNDFVVFSLNYTYTYSYISATGTTDCVVNKGLSDALVIDNGTTPQYSLVPENHDCINTYNNIINDLDPTWSNEFKYKKLTVPLVTHPSINDLGGTGPYISYSFVTTDIISAEQTTKGVGGELLYTLSPTLGSPGYTSQQYVLDVVGYQRDEVYRVAIDFYDLKGRFSYAKWISDIRMPDFSEEIDPLNHYDSTYKLCVQDLVSPTGIMNARVLGIKFTIDWVSINTDYPGLLDQLSGFQIVRCIRTTDDSTIKANGIIVPTHNHTPADGLIKASRYSSYNITSAHDYNDDHITPITGITENPPNLTTLDKTLVELISPEIAFNKSLETDTNDFLEVVGYIDNITADGTKATTVTPLNGIFNTYSVTATTMTAFSQTPLSISGWRKTVQESIISLPEARSPVTKMINSIPFTARGYDDSPIATTCMTFKGTTLVAGLISAFDNVTSGGAAGEEKALYGRYRKYLGTSIYGGSTYSERAYNQYIKAGEFTKIPDVLAITNYNVYGGDTYINPFSFLKLFVDMDAEVDNRSGQVLVSFPVESKINISHRLDKINNYTTVPTNTTYYLTELQTEGMSQFPNSYPNVGNLYRYNSAYSAENSSRSFIPKPFDFRINSDKDVMVTSSEIKTNGEYSDSWLKFKYNNYIELEGEYGAITRLINHNDKLLAFQPRGIAALSVLDREVVESNNTMTLAVGTGGILNRYDYLSKQNGTSFYDAICTTEMGIYFYNDKTNSINRIVDTLEPISDTKGMKSYFESTPYTSCLSAYDKPNREVLFSTTALNTLSFSGYIDAFEGFFTFTPTTYITFDKYLISSPNKIVFFLHNVGNYNEFYGSLQTSELTLLVNPNKDKVVTFNIIEWLTDLTVAGVDSLLNTFDSIRVTNTTQDTGLMTLSTRDDLKRRFRKWRLNTFRDQTLEDGLSCDKKIRDSWIKTVFTWTQTLPYKKLIIHPISFLWTPTKI